MIVYHGSNMVVDHPDVTHSYRDLDFGRGFYVTTVKEQYTVPITVDTEDFRHPQ